MSFKDHFSPLAEGYAAYRPSYPDALFAFLAAAAPGRACALDCATGSGQAATGLAKHFEHVVAIDASAEQLAKARPHVRVHYAVALAEASALAPRSADLVTVAQALHWFDLPRFYAEAVRVLRPAGLLAVWTYGLIRTGLPAIDTLVDHLYGAVLDEYWPPERRLVENGLDGLAFPFDPVPVPAFAMHAPVDLPHLLGYLRTWSAVRRYREARGTDPIDGLTPLFAKAFGAHDRIEVHWPLTVRAGRRPAG